MDKGIRFIFVVVISASLFSCSNGNNALDSSVDAGDQPNANSQSNSDWNHNENIDQAVLKFYSIHRSEGMQSAKKFLSSCYDEAVSKNSYKKIEYCFTFHIVGVRLDKYVIKTYGLPYSLGFREEDVVEKIHLALGKMGSESSYVTALVKKIRSRLAVAVKKAVKQMLEQDKS